MKETELKNTSEISEMEVQNLSGQDKARKHRKTAKAAISFVVMIVLLVALFFAAVNIGSLKVSFPELLKGLFVRYFQWSKFCGGTHYRICTDFIFLHSIICISWRCDCICLSLQPVMERGIKSSENYPCRCGSRCDVHRIIQCIKFYERRKYVRRGSNRQW